MTKKNLCQTGGQLESAFSIIKQYLGTQISEYIDLQYAIPLGYNPFGATGGNIGLHIVPLDAQSMGDSLQLYDCKGQTFSHATVCYY